MARAGGGVIISVRDHGPGIPEDRLAAVLTPFYRLEESRSRDTGGGAGLGLTIALRLVQLTEATLTLANHPGSGLEAQIIFGDRADQ